MYVMVMMRRHVAHLIFSFLEDTAVIFLVGGVVLGASADWLVSSFGGVCDDMIFFEESLFI